MLPGTLSVARSLRPVGLAALLALPLLGCVQTTGDFGRPQPGFTQDVLLPYTGLVSARFRGEPASVYALTEDEKELRNRAWNFLMPEPDAPKGTWQEGHLGFHRLLPPRQHDVTLFHAPSWAARILVPGSAIPPSCGDTPISATASPRWSPAITG